MATQKDLHVNLSVEEFEDPDELETTAPVILAQWPGECATCGDPFQDGDEIFKDETGNWSAVQCCGEDVGL